MSILTTFVIFLLNKINSFFYLYHIENKNTYPGIRIRILPFESNLMPRHLPQPCVEIVVSPLFCPSQHVHLDYWKVELDNLTRINYILYYAKGQEKIQKKSININKLIKISINSETFCVFFAYFSKNLTFLRIFKVLWRKTRQFREIRLLFF